VQASNERESRVAASSTQRDVDTVIEAVELSLERQAVRRCLAALTDLQRESVTLAYYSGYTVREVAELLAAPLPTVKTRVRDGLIRLRDCLGVIA
jgi:RNA polymerase sigma-70 factor (ECF subfamily)